jgi:hypothetical protein
LIFLPQRRVDRVLTARRATLEDLGSVNCKDRCDINSKELLGQVPDNRLGK